MPISRLLITDSIHNQCFLGYLQIHLSDLNAKFQMLKNVRVPNGYKGLGLSYLGYHWSNIHLNVYMLPYVVKMDDDAASEQQV